MMDTHVHNEYFQADTLIHEYAEISESGIVTASGPDSCLEAKDDFCDEPDLANSNGSDDCAAGTDTTDCSGFDILVHKLFDKCTLTHLHTLKYVLRRHEA